MIKLIKEIDEYFTEQAHKEMLLFGAKRSSVLKVLKDEIEGLRISLEDMFDTYKIKVQDNNNLFSIEQTNDRAVILRECGRLEMYEKIFIRLLVEEYDNG